MPSPSPLPAWQNCSRQFVWQNAHWQILPSIPARTGDASPDLFAYVPDVQLPGRFQSLASPPLPCPCPCTCQKHFFLPLLSVQHVTDTIEMENDMQHGTSSHGSTRATATTTRSAISWAAKQKLQHFLTFLQPHGNWSVKSDEICKHLRLPDCQTGNSFFQLYFWLFDRQTGRRQIMPGQNPKVQKKQAAAPLANI